MKPMLFAALLFASSPALADDPKPAPATPGQRSVEILLSREINAHQADLGAAIQLQDQNTALAKQVDELTKERDALKAKAKAEPSKDPAK